MPPWSDGASGAPGTSRASRILGGAAFWATESPEEARPSFELALDAGVNHLDIAPQYGNAERVVGPLVPAVRDRLFVAGKTLRSNPDGVEAQFDDTRRLLGCEVLDLYQAHGVTDLEVLDARAEAIDRIVALRDRGATRFAGITGHDLTAPGHLQRGAAPVGPRHRDVPRVPAAVGRPRVPRRCRGAAGHVHGARRRRDGHQGGRPPAVGRWPLAGRVARRRPGHGRALGRLLVRAGQPATPSREASAFALSTPGVHAFCTPGDTGLAPRGARRRRGLPGSVGRRARGGRGRHGRRAGHLPDPPLAIRAELGVVLAQPRAGDAPSGARGGRDVHRLVTGSVGPATAAATAESDDVDEPAPACRERLERRRRPRRPPRSGRRSRRRRTRARGSSWATSPPATAASSPNATQSAPGRSRPWPVIDIHTAGPPSATIVDRVDAELLERARPRRLDHDVGAATTSRERSRAVGGRRGRG